MDQSLIEGSNKNSKFKPFVLALANRATLSGIVYIPPRPSKPIPNRPLLVLLHGGGCHAHHYDVDEEHTASIAADALSIPVVSVNRPCYGGTSSLFPIPEESSFHRQTGKLEHEYIFPALWDTYGSPNGCNALVAMGHSLATPGLIVAASLHAEDNASAYPLAGLIISGWGTRPNKAAQKARLAWTPEERRANRHLLMLSDPSLDAADERIKLNLEAQTVDSPPEEAQECVDGPWSTYFPTFAKQVAVPMMFAVGEHDWLWEGTSEQLHEFSSFFPNCPRFDGSVVLGAPHAIEWSHYARGWYARCFGFALEVATYLKVKQRRH